MSQVSDIVLAAGISGLNQRTEINSIIGAMNSNHKGAARPATATAGTLWVDESGGATAWVLYFYDGADDIAIGTINTSSNTFTPSGQLGTFGNAVVAKTGGFTAVLGDFGKHFACNATSASFTAAIDTTSGLGSSWFAVFQKTDSTANTVTIDPAGTDTINGATTFVLSRQWDTVIVIKSGTNSFSGVISANGQLLAPLNSPALTGNPTAPTQSPGTNNTRIATTAYADAAVAALSLIYATLASPAFTGNPTAPTQSAADNSTRIATTAYVTTALSNFHPAANYQPFTSSGTWSKPSGFPATTLVLIECWGAGGGGSDNIATGANGGSSSVGSLCTAYGGCGGGTGGTGGCAGGALSTPTAGTQFNDIREGDGGGAAAATGGYFTGGGGGGNATYKEGASSVYGGGGGYGNYGGVNGSSSFAPSGVAQGGEAGSRGGGGGGSYKYRFVLLSAMGSTESVTVGAGGSGFNAGRRGEVRVTVLG